MTLLAGRYDPSGHTLKGGQGQVQVCRDIWLDRDVVVKHLHTGGDLKSLENEITIRQKVSSKYLAEIYDYFTGEDGEPRLVIEFIPGDEISSNSVVPVTEDTDLLRLLYQLASGINDFHVSGIVHRDIKPQNCRLDAEDILRIFDLGLSSDLSETDMTKLGAGTFGFLAPELFAKGDKAISSAIDVYAWGASAWFMSTANLPVALKTIPPQSKKLVPSFSSRTQNSVLADLVDRSLSVNPKNRPAMSEVVQKLRAELTFGMHKGLLVGHDGRQFVLDIENPTISIGVKIRGENISIHYDGYGFEILSSTGNVFVNNDPATTGQAFPSACVVTFGSPSLGAARTFLNFSSAHPEVVV